jgi:hypothetical protein
MDKQLFDDAIGEVPPSTVDVEAVITRGRRAARARAVANPAVAAGVAVVLLTGVVAFTLTREDDAGTTAGTPPPVTSSSAATSSATATTTTNITDLGRPAATPPAACTGRELESPAALNARLGPVAKAAFEAQRPDVQLLSHPAALFRGTAHGPFEFFQVTGENGPVELPVCEGGVYSMSYARTRAPDGDGSVMVVVEPSYYEEPSSQCEGDVSGGEVVDCVERVSPQGDRMTLTTSVLEGGTTLRRIDVVRADGTSVLVASENIDTSGKTGDLPTAAMPALGYEQLVAIATAPGMTVFP